MNVSKYNSLMTTISSTYFAVSVQFQAETRNNV